ncbi:MAG: OadG family transporter subunit [Clostridia bacterium]|nr:OadG family transporter subunit [Clostridia bacterium]
MDRLLNSLLVMVVGMLVVFFGLIVLIGLIKLITILTTEKKKAKVAEAPAPVAVAPVTAAPAAAKDDDALIAVITAAVSCMMEEGTAFTVRHVRRISNAPAWQKAGREEQIYSRF